MRSSPRRQARQYVQMVHHARTDDDTATTLDKDGSIIGTIIAINIPGTRPRRSTRSAEAWYHVIGQSYWRGPQPRHIGRPRGGERREIEEV